MHDKVWLVAPADGRSGLLGVADGGGAMPVGAKSLHLPSIVPSIVSRDRGCGGTWMAISGWDETLSSSV